VTAVEWSTRARVPVLTGPQPAGPWWEGVAVIILGLILLILGAVLSVPILWTLGIILIVVGAVLWILGSAGRQIGPRAHYW
jgi:membrane-bound ClpP family serine protease